MQCGKCGYNPHSPLAPWFTFNNNQSYSNHCTQKMFSSNLKNFGFYSRPPNTAPPFTGSPPNTAAHFQVPNRVFLSYI